MSGLFARCSQHKLVAQSDGLCPLCREDAKARRQSRLLRGLALSGLFLLGAFLVRREAAVVATTAPPTPPPARQSERHHSVQAQGRATDVQVEEAAPEPAPERSARDDLSRDADEQARRVAPVPSAVSAPAPPEPPRASVDPEPFVPDDPRDFELR